MQRYFAVRRYTARRKTYRPQLDASQKNLSALNQHLPFLASNTLQYPVMSPFLSLFVLSQDRILLFDSTWKTHSQLCRVLYEATTCTSALVCGKAVLSPLFMDTFSRRREQTRRLPTNPRTSTRRSNDDRQNLIQTWASWQK